MKNQFGAFFASPPTKFNPEASESIRGGREHGSPLRNSVSIPAPKKEPKRPEPKIPEEEK